MTDTGWRYLKKYGRIIVEGPEETYSLTNERTARNIAEGRAHGRMSIENAQHLERIDHSRYGAPKATRRAA